MKRLKIVIFLLFLSGALAGATPVDMEKVKALFEHRDFSKVKALCSSVAAGSADYAEAQYYLGRVAVEEKSYDESVKRFENAIEANPKSAEYHNWLGVMYGVLAIDANALKQAYLAPKIKNEFEKAAAIDPRNLPTQWGLINYYTKAPGFLGGSWDKAMGCAQSISRQDFVAGLRAYAFVHAAQKKTTLAEKELLEAMRTAPDDPQNDYALAQLYLDEKKYAQSLALYDNLLKKDPKNMVAAFHRGHASAQCGQGFEKAVVCLNQYLGYTPKPNEPSHSGAACALAVLYEKQGDKSRAKEYFLTALKLEPGMKEAREGLDRVE